MSTRVCILPKKSHHQKWGENTHRTRNKKQQTMSKQSSPKSWNENGLRQTRETKRFFFRKTAQARQEGLRPMPMPGACRHYRADSSGKPHSKSVGGVFRAKIAVSWIDGIRAPLFSFFLKLNILALLVPESTSCCIRS